MTVTVDGTNGITYPQGAAQIVGAGPAFSAYLNTSVQTITNSTFTKVTLNAELFDTNNNFDSTTNYRFTPTVAGYYFINGGAQLGGVTITNGLISIWKNGSEYIRGSQIVFTSGNSNAYQLNASSIIYMNGSTDYLELYGYITAASGNQFVNGSTLTYFNGCLIRGA